MKVTDKQFEKIQKMFSSIEFTKRRNEIHFYWAGYHYYLTKDSDIWCVYRVGRSIDALKRVLGKSFNEAMENFKQWLRDVE